MNSPKLSVIVAMFNTIDYLDVFFNSLKNQTFKDFEIIVVDDLSTDGSYEFVKNYSVRSDNLKIQLIKGKEKMLPDKARQIAYRECNGKYVISVDTDDEFSNDYFESLVSLAEKNNLDFAVSSCQRINEKSKKVNKIRYLSKKDIPLMTDKQKKCLIKGRYGGWNRMAKKEFLDKMGYDYLSAELPLFILQFDKNAKVGYTRSGCYFYRARGGSISTSKVPQRIADYDLLEPLLWYEKIGLSKKNAKVLGVYLFRMILPYIYYKRYFIKNYKYKNDIKMVKNRCNYSIFNLLRYWPILDTRDKVMSLIFAFHLHFIVFAFIKKYRS